MPQNDRNSRNRKHRRAYDQARDDRRGGQSTQRRSSAGAGSDLGYSGYAGYSSGGHPITNPNYDPDAPRPSRYTERTVNYGSYPDNSITFPTGGRSSQSGAQRPRSGQNGQRRRMTGTAGTASTAGPTIRPGMTGAAGRAPSAAAARVQAVTWGTAGTQDIPPAATPSRTPIMTPMRPAPAGTRSVR